MASDMTICYGRRLEDPDTTILLIFVGHIQKHPGDVKWDIVAVFGGLHVLARASRGSSRGVASCPG